MMMKRRKTQMTDPRQNVPMKAYNGRIGCMCGCKGNYVEDGRAFTRRVNKAMGFVGPVRPDSVATTDAVTYSAESFMNERYFAVEENGRQTVVYFTSRPDMLVGIGGLR